MVIPLTNHTFSERAKSSAHFGTKYAMFEPFLRFLYGIFHLYPIHIENLLTVVADTPECTKVPLLLVGLYQKQVYFSNDPD